MLKGHMTKRADKFASKYKKPDPMPPDTRPTSVKMASFHAENMRERLNALRGKK